MTFWERIRDLLTAHGKVHNLSLLIAAVSFARSAWVCTDATVVGAVGGTFAAIYGANAWAGKPRPEPPAPVGE